MIYFEIKDKNGKVIAGNMQSFFRRKDFENKKNFSENKNGKGLKGAYKNFEDIDIWFVVEDDYDLLKCTKHFKRTFKLFKIVAANIYKEYKNEVSAYAHILRTIQAQMRQQIDNFADSKEFRKETHNESIKNITNIIEADKESAADLICYIQKRIIDMQAHLSGVEVINLGEQYEVKTVSVSLRRAILNQCTPFMQEFEEKNVKIKFFFEDECEIKIDKNMFSLIMYNFFSNAVKYTRPNSEIRFHYLDNEKHLDISMVSLKMEKDELAVLSNDRMRGKHAKNISGEGIGLFVIQRALELMGKERMYISPNYEKYFNENGFVYNENHFKFAL